MTTTTIFTFPTASTSTIAVCDGAEKIDPQSWVTAVEFVQIVVGGLNVIVDHCGGGGGRQQDGGPPEFNIHMSRRKIQTSKKN
jgi:hypothetical protein